ncbi:hypothetical protein [Crossiella sp. NPDC003009]
MNRYRKLTGTGRVNHTKVKPIVAGTLLLVLQGRRDRPTKFPFEGTMGEFGCTVETVNAACDILAAHGALLVPPNRYYPDAHLPTRAMLLASFTEAQRAIVAAIDQSVDRITATAKRMIHEDVDPAEVDAVEAEYRAHGDALADTLMP